MSTKSFDFGACLLKSMAALCGILLVICAVLAFMSNNLVSVFLTPGIYKQALEAQKLYLRLPALVAEQVVYSMSYSNCLENPTQCQGTTPSERDGAPPEFIQNLTQEDWTSILSEIVPSDWIKNQFERIIDQTFIYLNSNQPNLDIKIPITELKDRLTGDAGYKAVLRFIQVQPACSAEQLDIFQQLIVTNVSLDSIPVCNPPEETLTRLTPYIQDLLVVVAGKLPNEIFLGNPPTDEGGTQSTTPEETDLRPTIRKIRLFVRLSPLLPILLLGLVTAFGVRSFRGLCWWWGIPAFLTGAILLLIGLTSVPLWNWAINAVLVRGSLDFSGLTVNIFHAFLELVRYLGKTFGLRSGIQGLVTASSGAVLIIVGLFIKKHPKAGQANSL